MTKGMKSSEFWLVLLTQLVTVFQAIQGTIDPKTATWIGAGLSGIYAFARAWVKGKEIPA